MRMCEPDPDIVRWGLNLLEGYPSTSTSYDELNIHNSCGTGYYGTEHAAAAETTDFNTGGPSCYENDEVIAHALQEELSQLAVVESSGSSHADGQNSQASVLAQDWYGAAPAVRYRDPGNEGWQENLDNGESSSSSSSPGESYRQGGGWPFEIGEDHSSLDGEVGKRLNHMVPVPHVPRINGEIPSVDEATSDHQRLLDRLRLYDLVELKVQGDGNCQFRALSDQIYRTAEHHKVVREQITSQLKSHPEFYEGYVPMSYDEYLEKMSKDGEWGDHVTLQAAADSYGLKIFVITSFKDTCYIEILPNVQKSKRVIFLSFWAEVHYNSIYPEGDSPALDAKKKKRSLLVERLPSYCSVM